jgi:GT2 family glycosyltransferase
LRWSAQIQAGRWTEGKGFRMLARTRDCSFIVTTYNRAELLRKTLTSIYTSDTSKDTFEVVVVDDGSSDHALDVVRTFEHHQNIKYVRQPDDGFQLARARNLGIAIAEGEICIFTDPGILISPAFIHAHRDAHRLAKNTIALGILVGIYNCTEREQTWLNRCAPDRVGDFLAAPESRDMIVDPRQKCFAVCGNDLNKLPMPWAFSWTANVSMRRNSILAAGGFDENYRSWGQEDNDMALALHKGGANFSLVPDAIALHLPHEVDGENSKTNANNKRYLHDKYRMRETELYMNSSSLILNASLSLPESI